MPSEALTALEHIRSRPAMYLPVHPARTLFKYFLGEFTALHAAGKTQSIRVDHSRTTLAIGCSATSPNCGAASSAASS